ncbi:MAG: toll/interleukin-1 receptor domain-containing protein [Planctomycetes bacterium]|nr:toll/interleukin-1 receptor domain-containing protein [Planctomycetota bacterium]
MEGSRYVLVADDRKEDTDFNYWLQVVNHLIADARLVWKSGVILEREKTRAEVIEDYSRRKILVRVVGPDTRGLLVIVDDQLERIHASFPPLKYHKLLPCNCDGCRARTETCAFPFRDLVDFARQGDQIQCRVSRKLVDAANLIRDVLPAAMHPRSLHALDECAAAPAFAPTSALDPCGPPERGLRNEAYVSYARAPESMAVVERLEGACRDREITLVSDQTGIGYKASIREFMKRIGRGTCVLVVVSKAYLRSESCMFELTEIADRGDLRGRVFPIVLPDAKIAKAIDLLDYVQYWETEREQLDAKMKTVGAADLHGIREELDLYVKIRGVFARIIDTLADMKAVTLDQDPTADLGVVMRALEERLSG